MASSSIFWPNIPRLATAICEWLACLQVIMMVRPDKRAPHLGKSLLVLACLAGQIFLQMWAGTWPLTLWFLGIVINILWMLLTIWIAEPQASWRQLLYGLCRAFVTAETLAAVVWQLICMLILPLTNNSNVVLVLTTLLFLVFCLPTYWFQRHLVIQHITNREIAVAALTALIIFAISNIGFISNSTQDFLGGSAVIFTIRSFVDICGLLILALEDRQRAVNNLQSDLDAVNKLMQSQYQQYQEYKQSSELVNQHFHDLKHQLTILALEDDPQKRRKYLDEISNDIHLYDVGVKTGNKIADVILTRKNAYCKQHQITFTCIANGALLNMINTMDLCSLLGNSLDNAIENVEKIDDPEKRLINMRIVKKGQMVLYQVENFTTATQDFDDLPKTTKKDKSRHGYGLKSIRHIAGKYNGTMTVSIKHHWFRLTVLFNDVPDTARAQGEKSD